MLQEAENAIPLDDRLPSRMSSTNGATSLATKTTNGTCSSPFSWDTSAEQVEELHKHLPTTNHVNLPKAYFQLHSLQIKD